MSALKLNGIALDAIVAATNDLKDTTRDVGAIGDAVDGSKYVTRSARKIDFAFKTIPLSLADALAWWSLLTGEGEVWSYDANLYGSKGSPPFSTVGTVAQSAGSSKYGAGKLSLGASSAIAYAGAGRNSFGRTDQWTVAVWRNTGAGYSQYIVNSLGQKWVDGVRNDAASTTFIGMSSGDLTISNTSGTTLFDDLVAVPFVMPLDWPAQLAASGAAFGPLPFLALTGDFVLEQATRLVVGTVKDGSVLRTASGTLKSLDVELAAK